MGREFTGSLDFPEVLVRVQLVTRPGTADAYRRRAAERKPHPEDEARVAEELINQCAEAAS